MQHGATQKRAIELGLIGFGCVGGVLAHEKSSFLLYCGGFTLQCRIDSGFAVLIIVLLIFDTALLAVLHELMEGGLPPTAALEELLGLRHCQLPREKNVHSRVQVDFLRKFVSLLLKPQIFLDRRFSTHCWDKRGPNETHVSHEKTSLMANPQSKNMSRLACKIEKVVQHKLLQDSERNAVGMA